MKYYYLGQDRKPQGPVELSQLLNLYETGQLVKDVLVVQEQGEEWLPIESLLSQAALPQKNPLNKALIALQDQWKSDPKFVIIVGFMLCALCAILFSMTLADGDSPSKKTANAYIKSFESGEISSISSHRLQSMPNKELHQLLSYCESKASAGDQQAYDLLRDLDRGRLSQREFDQRNAEFAKSVKWSFQAYRIENELSKRGENR